MLEVNFKYKLFMILICILRKINQLFNVLKNGHPGLINGDALELLEVRGNIFSKDN